MKSSDHFENDISIPLNVIKEKIKHCLPKTATIDDEAILAINYSLNYFLKSLAKNIPIDQNGEKKILIKDIKNFIEINKEFIFLKKLIEKF